jgi:TRAP-type C4-dicarboxylate transport system substrate-binding protein
MKKGLTIFVGLSVIILAFTLVIGTTTSARAAAIQLTYSNFFPPSHIQSKLAAAWCKEVEKRTNGKVKITYYPGGTLTKGKNCYDGVVNGLSDIGMSVLAYTRGRFPIMQAVDLPLGYTSGKVATNICNAVYNKFKDPGFNDTQVMYLMAHGPGILFTRKKAVRKLEDLKGMKIRAHGTTAALVKALGGTPVAMPMPELYQALQKGVVDGALYPMEVNKGWKMAEQVKYCTMDLSCSYTTSFFVVMNKKKWNSLPKDVQKTIDEINKEWIPKHGAAWDSSDAAGRKYFKKKGGEIITLSKAELARWKKASRPVITGYIAQMKKKGINGKEIVDYIESMLKK